MMSTGLLDERQKTDALERAYKLKKQTLSMLPDAAKNVKKLQDIYTATAKKVRCFFSSYPFAFSASTSAVSF